MKEKINKIVKLLILSDLLFFAGWGLISPIFSVFIVEEIIGATVVTVGTASALYWMARSSIQIPIARFMDKREGEKDDLYALVFALSAVGVAAFVTASVQTPSQLYIAHAFHGSALGIYQVAWPSIFSRHMDKGKISLDWSLDRASIGIAVAIASIVGAMAVQLWGFRLVLVITGIISLASALVLMIWMPKLLFPNENAHQKTPLAIAHHKHKHKSTPGL